MNISVEEKKLEAVKRMKALGIFPQTIKQFEKEGYVSISEPLFGAFYWAEGEDLKAIREFEEKYNAVVYLVVRAFMSIGMMDSYLYVSDHKDEWEMDNNDLNNGEVMSYTMNREDEYANEFGYIGVEKTMAAGLRRVW